MNLICAPEIRATLDGASVARIDGEPCGPLARALTVLSAAQSLSELRRFRAFQLLRDTDLPISDYQLVAGRASVGLRPADNQGHPYATTDTEEGLMAVTTVILLAVHQLDGRS